MAGPRASDGCRLEPLAEEQAALRRVATLVAQGAAAETLFTVVAEQVAEVLSVPLVSIVRYEPDGTATERASVSPQGTMFRVGTRWSLEGTNVVALVRDSAQPARIDDYSGLAGMIAEACRRVGIRSRVGVPIVVAGRLWGAMVVSSLEPDILPQETEARLTDFTELVATAIANSEARDEAGRLAAEQAALRRVATLVAEDVPSSELFSAVAREVGTLLGADFAGMARFEDGDFITIAAWAAAGEFPPYPDRWQVQPGDPATTIAEASRPVRWDDWTDAPGPIAAFIRDEMGARSTVGCPVVVAGRVWGALAVHSKQPGQLPPDTQSRVWQFTDLVATAIANAETRAEVARLAREQAALRRVATLVAREASQAEVFTAIVEEIGPSLGTEESRMVRYEDERSAIVVASSGEAEGVFPAGTRLPLGGEDAVSRVLKTGQPVRIDDYATASGMVAGPVRSIGIRCVVATPVVVEGRLWGAMVTGTPQEEPLPPQTESRLGQFTELIATAIANAEARSRAGRLAEEQAALRRVATLVAQEAPPAEVFGKVAEEMATVLGDAECALWRDEGDGTAAAVALWGGGISAAFRLGERVPIDGQGLAAVVIREGRPRRLDDISAAPGDIANRGRAIGVRAAIASPIVVRGRTWGALGAGRYTAEPFPPETEMRVARFAELVATAVANADTRAEVKRLADEQAALRRVATLVAHESPPADVFAAVAEEVAQLLRVEDTTIFRYEDDWTATVVADRGERDVPSPIGSRMSLEGESATALVRRTGRAARVDDFSSAAGPLAEYTRDAGIGSTVGSPIVVDGRLWGAMIAATRTDEPMPADTESRIEQFTELVATAISNMQARSDNLQTRSDLAASRARLVTAGDEARRRVVHDLHDGAQQRLVHTIVMLKLAQRSFRDGDDKTGSLLGEALEQAERGNEELRELAHGILPAALTLGGLRAGVDAVVTRVDLPVAVDVPAERFPAETEASAYFIVAEALTNVVKHSNAESAEVRATVEDGRLHVEVRDDGVGGADPDGHGLLGMTDRVTALGGRLIVDSPAGGGTLVAATLPLSAT
jgi:GAF domain-containing protein